MTNLKELSERLAWEALEDSGNTKKGRAVMREAVDVLAALGETHVVVPREPTPAMLKALFGNETIDGTLSDQSMISLFSGDWENMLAAVPSPER